MNQENERQYSLMWDLAELLERAEIKMVKLEMRLPEALNIHSAVESMIIGATLKVCFQARHL